MTAQEKLQKVDEEIPERKRKKSVSFVDSPIVLKQSKPKVQTKASPAKSPQRQKSQQTKSPQAKSHASTKDQSSKSTGINLKKAVQATIKKQNEAKGSFGANSVRRMSKKYSRKDSMMPEPWPFSESFDNLGDNDISMKSLWMKGFDKKGKKNAGKKKSPWDSIDFKKQLNFDIFDVAKMMAAKGGVKLENQHHGSSSGELFASHQVMDVLSSVQQQQQKRHQTHITTELRSIQKRVRKTLEEVGMEESEDEACQVDMSGGLKLPQIYDTKAERERMDERIRILDRVDRFEEKAIVRKQYLTELNFWFEDNLSMGEGMATPEEMKERVQEAQDINILIKKILQAFMRTGDKVVVKGKELLEETGKIIEERRQQMSKRTKKERIIVFDDKALLVDPIKWENAAKTIISVFDDSHKMIKNLMFKNALRLGQKQFEYMMLASDKRYKDLDDKKKQCFELQGKLHQAKMQTERIQKEMEEQKKKMTKMANDVTESKQALEKLQERNREMHFKMVDLNSKIKFLEVELREKDRTPPPPPTPPEPETVIVKVVDSATELRLKEVEAELYGAKMQLETMQQRLTRVSEHLKSEQAKNKQLEERLLEFENMESPEPNAPQAIEIPEATDRDSMYYKTLMSGMRNEFETEMTRIKTHMKREKVRSIAGMKKMEMLHKDHLSMVNKDTVRMLRAIMHFRDHMLRCLEKESLIDQAQALQDLGDLVKDKLSPDPREVLATVVGTVVDYLHNLEGILSTSFLAMKILMKYQIEKQVEGEILMRLMKERQDKENKKTIKEVVKQKKHLAAAKDDVSGLAKRLKKAKNKLRKTKDDIESFTPDKRYMDLLSRYNNMQRGYKNMQKEMEILHNDFNNTMKKKLEEKETMIISKIQMEMKNQKAINEEQLILSISDQKENLKMLSKAYEENKISKELHSMATAMIQKTLDIPRKKLKNLFEQYIAFRAVEESKERVIQVLSDEDEDLPNDTKNEMKLYLEQMDGKFTSSMQEWREKMDELENEKRAMNRKIYRMFNEVLLETGLILVHPLLKGSNKRVVFTRAATTVTRSQMQSLLWKRKRKPFKHFLGPPEELQGCAMSIQYASQKFWEKQKLRHRAELQSRSSRCDISPNIVSPHLLAYEINKPRINAVRSCHNMRRRAFMVGQTEGFHIDEMNFVQLVRDQNITGYLSSFEPETHTVEVS